MGAHIIDNELNPFYKKWAFHGEFDIPVPPIVTEVVDEANIGKDEIVDVIHDFFCPSNDPGSNDVDVKEDVVKGPTMSA